MCCASEPIYSPFFCSRLHVKRTRLRRYYMTSYFVMRTPGCILLNAAMTDVVLVKCWKGKSRGLPKGKINQGEQAIDAAVREVSVLCSLLLLNGSNSQSRTPPFPSRAKCKNFVCVCVCGWLRGAGLPKYSSGSLFLCIVYSRSSIFAHALSLSSVACRFVSIDRVFFQCTHDIISDACWCRRWVFISVVVPLMVLVGVVRCFNQYRVHAHFLIRGCFVFPLLPYVLFSCFSCVHIFENI